MKCIEILMNEHQKILKVMSNLEIYLGKENCDPDLIEAHLDFFSNYADTFHHAKEEGILFKWMIKNNPGLEFGPVAVMLHEHDLGRDLIKQAHDLIFKLKQSFEKTYFEELRERLGMFINLLRQHISKEDNVLYVMANNLDQRLNDGDEFMLPLFNAVKLGESEQQKLNQLLNPAS